MSKKNNKGKKEKKEDFEPLSSRVFFENLMQQVKEQATGPVFIIGFDRDGNLVKMMHAQNEQGFLAIKMALQEQVEINKIDFENSVFGIEDSDSKDD